MKKLLLILAACTLSIAPAYAGEVIKVNVNGLVCDFCARALEKVFSKQEAVSNIDVDLTKKLVTVFLKEGASLSDENVTNLITDSGYNVEAIHHE